MGGRFRGLGGGIGEKTRAANAAIGRTLFPHFCLVCGKEGRLLCGTCEAEKYAPERGIFFSLCDRRNERPHPIPPPQAGEGVREGGIRSSTASSIRCFSAGRYADPVLRQLLQLYKYGRVEEAGQILSDFLAMRVGRHVATLLDGESDPVVMPLPMNPINRALRGFNQAESLALAVSRELELEMVDGAVRRRFAWKAQASLTDPRKRRDNISGAFEARGSLHGRDVLLVDDVFTTGATVRECAAALMEAGAGKMTVVTVLKG